MIETSNVLKQIINFCFFAYNKYNVKPVEVSSQLLVRVSCFKTGIEGSVIPFVGFEYYWVKEKFYHYSDFIEVENKFIGLNGSIEIIFPVNDGARVTIEFSALPKSIAIKDLVQKSLEDLDKENVKYPVQLVKIGEDIEHRNHIYTISVPASYSPENKLNPLNMEIEVKNKKSGKVLKQSPTRKKIISLYIDN